MLIPVSLRSSGMNMYVPYPSSPSKSLSLIACISNAYVNGARFLLAPDLCWLPAYIAVPASRGSSIVSTFCSFVLKSLLSFSFDFSSYSVPGA